MDITSIGYERAITYAQLGVLLQHAGAQYSVFGADAFRCVVNSGGGERSVRVLPGRAAGQGIIDEMSDAATLVAAPAPPGDRWDLVALRRNWATSGTQLVLVQGTSRKGIPDTRLNQPGVHDDQPIALVRVSAGMAEIQEVVDLRVWHGDGGCTARNRLVLDYLGRIGTRVYVTDRTYVLSMGADGNERWVTDSVIFSTTQPSPADVPWLQVP